MQRIGKKGRRGKKIKGGNEEEGEESKVRKGKKRGR